LTILQFFQAEKVLHTISKILLFKKIWVPS